MSKERKLLERIIKHFEKQGKFARISSGCVYRTIDDEGHVIRCALGCLIPKSKYTGYIESIALYGYTTNEKMGNLQKLHEILVDLGLYRYRDFLGEMQEMHDNYALGRFDAYEKSFDDYMADLKSRREVYE
jgi:hypothetical protein